MSNLPPITEHAFMREIRKLVNATPPKPMTRIASDLGVDVDELCAWVMEYKEPKRKAYQHRDGMPLPEQSLPQREHWGLSGDAQRLANWRRQKEAAAAARKSIAIPVRPMAERAEAE